MIVVRINLRCTSTSLDDSRRQRKYHRLLGFYRFTLLAKFVEALKWNFRLEEFKALESWGFGVVGVTMHCHWGFRSARLRGLRIPHRPTRKQRTSVSDTRQQGDRAMVQAQQGPEAAVKEGAEAQPRTQNPKPRQTLNHPKTLNRNTDHRNQANPDERAKASRIRARRAGQQEEPRPGRMGCGRGEGGGERGGRWAQGSHARQF